MSEGFVSQSLIAPPQSPDVPLPPVRLRIPSPIGDLGLELRGLTVSEVIIDPGEEESFVPFTELESSDTLDEILGRLSEYFAGARRELGLDYDLRSLGLSRVARKVLRETARIPYGATRTHQQVAKGAGLPDGYRVVLSTLVTNPLPVVIPCHRVVPAKSGVGSYIAGSERKEWLLEMESKAVAQGSAPRE